MFNSTIQSGIQPKHAAVSTWSSLS